MKAVIETMEPVIRPATARPNVVKPLRQHRVAFVPLRAETTLFHAWRA